MDSESNITIKISGLGGRCEHDVPSGTTVGDLRALGHIAQGVGVRQAGVDVPDSTEVVDGGNYVTTPPAAKHG